MVVLLKSMKNVVTLLIWTKVDATVSSSAHFPRKIQGVMTVPQPRLLFHFKIPHIVGRAVLDVFLRMPPISSKTLDSFLILK